MTKVWSEADKHVGQQIRARRVLIGMSQEQLGEALGLTFQQIQKYEEGRNRVSAGRMMTMADILGVTPAYFLEGAPSMVSDLRPGKADAIHMASYLQSPEIFELIKAYSQITDAATRRSFLSLARAVATQGGKLQN